MFGRERLEDGRLWVTISALQHYSYCPRQCALIHIEQTYEENIYTLRGRRAHARVDSGVSDIRVGRRSERSLPLWSEELGVIGVADVVEFDDVEGALAAATPVEYKHGTRHEREHDDIQVCAQALCLEEMFDVPVTRGFVYHISSRRRREVAMSTALRARTLEVIESVRLMLEASVLPAPVADSRCRRCSLVDACMPYALKALKEGP